MPRPNCKRHVHTRSPNAVISSTPRCCNVSEHTAGLTLSFNQSVYGPFLRTTSDSWGESRFEAFHRVTRRLTIAELRVEVPDGAITQRRRLSGFSSAFETGWHLGEVVLPWSQPCAAAARSTSSLTTRIAIVTVVPGPLVAFPRLPIKLHHFQRHHLSA